MCEPFVELCLHLRLKGLAVGLVQAHGEGGERTAQREGLRASTGQHSRVGGGERVGAYGLGEARSQGGNGGG